MTIKSKQYRQINQRIIFIFLTFIVAATTLFLSGLTRNSVVFADAASDALNSYCHTNHSVSLLDGTDAEIVCRNGDPDGILKDPDIKPLYDAVTAPPNPVDQCEALYHGNQQAIDSCNGVSNAFTGSGRLPVGKFNDKNPIISKIIKPFSQGLAALVGVVVVLSIVISGIQYSSARDNPQMVAAAKNRIVMSLLALLLLMFAGAILNWLTPGGLFQ
jgi:hypothetical protein